MATVGVKGLMLIIASVRFFLLISVYINCVSVCVWSTCWCNCCAVY